MDSGFRFNENGYTEMENKTFFFGEWLAGIQLKATVWTFVSGFPVHAPVSGCYLVFRILH